MCGDMFNEVPIQACQINTTYMLYLSYLLNQGCLEEYLDIQKIREVRHFQVQLMCMDGKVTVVNVCLLNWGNEQKKEPFP